MKPQNDVLRVQVRLNESELGIRKTEDALRLSMMNFCHLIGKPLGTECRVSGRFPEIEKDINIQISDITARPEYVHAGQSGHHCPAAGEMNRSELLPQIGLKGSYDYMHGLELNDQLLLDKGSFSVFLNVSIPIFHFGERSYKVRAAEAKLEQSRMEQANLNQQMLLELAQTANNLDEARLECELADRSFEQAQRNMGVSKSQYDVGLEALSDYLEVQPLWQQAYETRVDAHFRLCLNYIGRTY